ncbi:MAG TPA: hypothetical protein V6C50_13145 [Crinalium sp.]
MTPKELKHQIERLKQDDSDERQDALYILATSLDDEAVDAMLLTLDELGKFLSASEASTIIFAILPSPRIYYGLPSLIAYLGKSPLSVAGQDCAYILGEIASFYPDWHQGKNPDSRIVPALLRAAETAFQEQNFHAFGTCLYSLRQCVRYSPIPEAEQLMRSALLLMMQENILYEMGVLAPCHSLEILRVNANDQEIFFAELQAMLDKLQPEHNLLAELLEEFLEKKQQGDDYC